MHPQSLIVGICTYRRPSLAEAIRSVFVQTRKADRIIVVDNDIEPTAEPIIRALREESDTTLVYRHVPGGNIAVARNAVLDLSAGHRLAFLDDDEMASPRWLAELEAALHDGGVAAVFGPQIALYQPSDPAWMRALSPHSFHGHLIEGALQSGSTGNCLIDLSHPALQNRRFDRAAAPFGGSDTQFFVEAYRAGARYAFAPSAKVSERVPPHRARWSWLLRRRYRYGHTHARVTGKSGAADAFIAFAKLSYCGMIAAMRGFDPVGRRASILRGALHAGVLAAALGRKGPAEYSPPQKG
ncbi:MAG: glycosyltransferase [Parvularcula sp.]